ncbi:hypothetical protein Tco_0344823 [Tanacetum coccineum]
MALVGAMVKNEWLKRAVHFGERMDSHCLAKRVVIILLVIVMLAHFIQASSESFDQNQGNRRELRTRSKAPPAPNLRPNVQYNPPVILGSPPPPPPTRNQLATGTQRMDLVIAYDAKRTKNQN